MIEAHAEYKRTHSRADDLQIDFGGIAIYKHTEITLNHWISHSMVSGRHPIKIDLNAALSAIGLIFPIEKLHQKNCVKMCPVEKIDDELRTGPIRKWGDDTVTDQMAKKKKTSPLLGDNFSCQSQFIFNTFIGIWLELFYHNLLARTTQFNSHISLISFSQYYSDVYLCVGRWIHRFQAPGARSMHTHTTLTHTAITALSIDSILLRVFSFI